MQLAEVVSKLTPIITIIILGRVLKKTGLITEEGGIFIKKIIINIGLPSVMFLSFMRMEITPSLALFIPGMFVLNIALLLAGKVAAKAVGGNYSPFLFTGFEYGMFAVAVFTAAYGAEAVSYIAIIDLGHELFIWFILVSLMISSSGGKQTPAESLRTFIKSPIIISIAAGITVNLLDLESFLNSNPVAQGAVSTADMLMSLTAPLILLSIGAGLSLSKSGLGFALKVTSIRLPIVLGVYFLFGSIFMQRILNLSFPFEAAFFTLVISPPPFIIPMFVPEDSEKEAGNINTTLTVYTIISLILFTVFFSIHPVL